MARERVTPSPEIHWANWANNQRFRARRGEAASEPEIMRAIAAEYEAGGRLRVAGAGHSFTPIVATSGTLLELTGERGVARADPEGPWAEVWGPTSLRDLGPALWDVGISLRNQGDTDGQTIAGATATGTKGSGVGTGSISSEILALTLVDGRGRLRVIDCSSPDHLRAARVSLGLLGVVTRVRLRVATRYGLREHNAVLPLDEVLATASQRLSRYHHFSFLWCPSERTTATSGLPALPADHCYVKQLERISADDSAVARGPGVAGIVGRRTGRSYLIYADWNAQVGRHVELEYMVGAPRWREAFEAVRRLMLDEHPDQLSLVQVRWQQGDDADLSAQNGRDTVSIALVSRAADADRFLRAVHDVLQPCDPRPHWGKMHYFNADEIARAFPGLAHFREVRSAYDPGGVFLNDHFQELLLGRA